MTVISHVKQQPSIRLFTVFKIITLHYTLPTLKSKYQLVLHCRGRRLSLVLHVSFLNCINTTAYFMRVLRLRRRYDTSAQCSHVRFFRVFILDSFNPRSSKLNCARISCNACIAASLFVPSLTSNSYQKNTITGSTTRTDQNGYMQFTTLNVDSFTCKT